MIAWKKLSRVQKVLTGIAASVVAVVTLAGFIVAAYSHFMTDAEAAEQHSEITDSVESYQAQQYRADKQDRVDRINREINRLEYDLLDTEMTTQQREYKKRLIGRQEKKIECIQADQC